MCAPLVLIPPHTYACSYTCHCCRYFEDPYYTWPCMVLGILWSLALVGTTALRYKFIILECNISTTLYTGFENTVYIFMDFLRGITFFFFFLRDTCGYYRKSEWIACFVILVISMLLAISTSVVSHLRDIRFTNVC
jgi:hypothetical protein